MTHFHSWYNLTSLKEKVACDPIGLPDYLFERYEELNNQTKDLEESKELTEIGDTLVRDIRSLWIEHTRSYNDTFIHILDSKDESPEFVNKQYDLIEEWDNKVRVDSNWNKLDEELMELCTRLDKLNREARPPVVPEELQQIIVAYALDEFVMSMPDVFLVCKSWSRTGKKFVEKYKKALETRQDVRNRGYYLAQNILEGHRIHPSHFKGKFSNDLRKSLKITLSFDYYLPYDILHSLQSIIDPCINDDDIWGELRVKNLDGIYGWPGENPRDRSGDVMDVFKKYYPNNEEWRVAFFTFSDAFSSMIDRYNRNNMRSNLCMNFSSDEGEDSYEDE